MLRRRSTLLALALVCAVLGACTAPGGPSRDSATKELRSGAPAWVGAEDGWGKLDRIERWLAQEAMHYAPYWRLQGELALAEGRADFAREDSSTRSAGRLSAARLGFERVLEDPEASASQRDRARRGLELAARLDPSSDETLTTTAGVTPRSAWRASPPRLSGLRRATGGYQRITVHHTADVGGALFDGSKRDSESVLRQIQDIHMSGNGWADIGYHYLIDSAGHVYQGRELRWQGAHAGGDNNRGNLGVCLLGNYSTQRPSRAAQAALTRLVSDLRREHGIPRTGLHAHKEFKNTACPGPYLAAWTADYRRNGPPTASLGGTQPARVARSASAPARVARGTTSGAGRVR